MRISNSVYKTPDTISSHSCSFLLSVKLFTINKPRVYKDSLLVKMLGYTWKVCMLVTVSRV